MLNYYKPFSIVLLAKCKYLLGSNFTPPLFSFGPFPSFIHFIANSRLLGSAYLAVDAQSTRRKTSTIHGHQQEETICHQSCSSSGAKGPHSHFSFALKSITNAQDLSHLSVTFLII